ncbi:MAG: Uma2 family endonuclease [Myxococcaceae bacterium]|nr:Uma2 family endonuclease [Myxococcaceae bacterium]MCI0670901.1 Uma2 family endonuclease [Myxococcaceae bacterium]
MTLWDIRWKDYEAILRMLGDQAGVRVSYLRGILEFMSPSERHESLKKMIARLLEMYALEHDIELVGKGSMTIRKREKERGAEPDECYFVNRTARGFPDLAIEVVLSHGAIDKFELYAGLGVKELWLWEDGTLHVYRLRGERYARARKSHLLPELDLSHLARFVEREDQTRAVREYRDSLRARH